MTSDPAEETSAKERASVDEMLVLALVKLVEIVGEAASRASNEYQAEHSQIPWSAMIGMGNRLVHAYFDINLKILWQTTQEDLP